MPRERLQRNPEKLDVKLSFRVRYGHDEDDEMVFMDEQPMNIVGSVFQYRDRAMKFLTKALVKVALLQGKAAAQATRVGTKAGARGAKAGAKAGVRSTARATARTGKAAVRRATGRQRKPGNDPGND